MDSALYPCPEPPAHLPGSLASKPPGAGSSLSSALGQGPPGDLREKWAALGVQAREGSAEGGAGADSPRSALDPTDTSLLFSSNSHLTEPRFQHRSLEESQPVTSQNKSPNPFPPKGPGRHHSLQMPPSATQTLRLPEIRNRWWGRH